ncbi:SH3 domain-containing protein [Plasmodiophora brassicae]
MSGEPSPPGSRLNCSAPPPPPPPGWSGTYVPGMTALGITQQQSSSKAELSQLADQVEVVFERLNSATQAAKQLATFYQSLAAIEQTYSKSLSKLVQSTSFPASDSMQKCLATVLMTAEARAGLHAQFAVELQDRLANDMNELSNHLKKERQQARSIWADADKALKSQTASVDKHFIKYAQSIKDSEKEIALRNDMARDSVASAKNLPKQEKRVADAISKYRARRESYSDSIEMHDKLHKQYAKTCSYILVNVEATDTSRLHKMQSSLSSFHRVLRDTAQRCLGPIESFGTAVMAIDPADDIAKFVVAHRTSSVDKLPPAMQFVEIRSDVIEEEENTRESRSGTRSHSATSEHGTESRSLQHYAISGPMSHLSVNGRSAAETEQSPVFYRAIYDYSEDQADVLSFVIGEFIRLEEPVSGGWASGLLNGRRGLFPLSYCDKIDAQRVEVTFDFRCTDNDSHQLTMSAGEPLWVLDASDRHWIWCADRHGAQGNFPAAYTNPPPRPTNY